jgi:hypothetical protein
MADPVCHPPLVPHPLKNFRFFETARLDTGMNRTL